MLALRKTHALPGLELEEVPAPPAPGPGQVLIEVAAAGICGSDLHIDAWTSGYSFMTELLPLTLGHEFCGRVRALGPGVEQLDLEQLVAVYPVITCGHCDECVRGDPGLCASRKALGVTQDGAFARYVLAPAANCVILPAHLDPAVGALLEPLCIGEQANFVGEVGQEDVVVVLGPGTVGQAAARVARWRGAARVVVVGLDDAARLETALQVGATDVIDLAGTADLQAEFERLTGRSGADVVIEATGHASSIGDGMRLLKKGGVLVVAGIHGQPAPVDLVALVRKRIQIRGAHSSRRPAWDLVAQRIADDPDSVRPMISMTLPLAEAPEALARCKARSVSKVMLRP